MVYKEFTGTGLSSPIYVRAALSEPALGKGIPIGTLVKRTASGLDIIRDSDATPIAVFGVVVFSKPNGDGTFECDILVAGVYSGEAYEYDTTSGNWVSTARHKSGYLQAPVYFV